MHHATNTMEGSKARFRDKEKKMLLTLVDNLGNDIQQVAYSALKDEDEREVPETTHHGTNGPIVRLLQHAIQTIRGLQICNR